MRAAYLSMTNNDWYPDVPDYVDLAFRTARKEFGESIKLFLNDYHIGDGSLKEKCVYDLVKITLLGCL